MKKIFVWSGILTAVGLIAFVATILAASDINVKRNQVREFITLPADAHFPEGITVNPETGQIYVGTFDGENSKLLRFDDKGKLEAQRDFAVSLLGLTFNPQDEKLYIATVPFSPEAKIQRIGADFAKDPEDVATVPSIGVPPNRVVENPDGSQDTIEFDNNIPVPNALTFSDAGDLFVSDSFQGAIFKIEDAGSCLETPEDEEVACVVETVAHDGLLATAGFPPFGANGLALSGNENTLYVANTGDDRVLKVDVSNGAVSVFAESINGADGIAIDSQGRLWVAANQADEIVALDDAGRVVAKFGDFLGIKNGTARGLLFPASPVIVNDRLYVTNLALPLTEAVGDEPEEEITNYTVSVLKIF